MRDRNLLQYPCGSISLMKTKLHMEHRSLPWTSLLTLREPDWIRRNFLILSLIKRPGQSSTSKAQAKRSGPNNTISETRASFAIGPFQVAIMESILKIWNRNRIWQSRALQDCIFRMSQLWIPGPLNFYRTQSFRRPSGNEESTAH